MPHSQVSEKQLAANRANARKSTGPRTPEGKARSSQNARKHGLAASLAAASPEDLEELARLKSSLFAFYRPVNSEEQFALERVAQAQQTLLRASRLESGLTATCLNTALKDRAAHRYDHSHALGEGFHRMARQSNSWTLFLRYHAQADREYRRAIFELRKLIKAGTQRGAVCSRLQCRIGTHRGP